MFSILLDVYNKFKYLIMTKLIEFENPDKELLRGLINEANSDNAIIFVHGFERTTIESKFKNIIDVLDGKINLLRLDFSGCGLSDGSFKDITVAKMVRDLDTFINNIKSIYPNIKTFNFVSHSLGACVVAEYITSKEVNFNKLVFLAPAFNQRVLHRLWFTQSKIAKESKNTTITLANYLEYFDEREFLLKIETELIPSKEHYISNLYFTENKDADYQDRLYKIPSDHMLIIHSLLDDKVPYYSNDKIPDGVKKVQLQQGNHDLEYMPVVETYITEVINFLVH